MFFFFYSGHGIGVEASNTNYLLLRDIKSLQTYARGQMSEADRRRDDIVALKMPEFQGQYETDEIAKNGVSVSYVMNAIAGRKPKVAIIFLDACRSFINSSGSRLVPPKDLPRGSVVIFSASFGESAIKSFSSSDHRRNSLFAAVFRSELQRPGQTLGELGQRVSRMVRAFAFARGYQQEPTYFENLGSNDDFALVNSIGAERFQLTQDPCAIASVNWDEIASRPDRDALESHLRRFRGCPTAKFARRALLSLIGSSELAAGVGSAGPIDDCDRLAASDSDPARPPDVPGVALDKIDFEMAAAACQKSIMRNPRVIKFLFDLGRAKFAAANDVGLDDPTRKPLIAEARAAYEDAAAGGYVAALYALATLSDYTDISQEEQARAIELLLKAANQGLPLAMYELGRRYSQGTLGETRDDTEAYHWMSEAAESGWIPAMVEAADALFQGRGVQPNPRRAIEWAQRAANSGSDLAELRLCSYYFTGKEVYDSSGQLDPTSLPSDENQALLWCARAASSGNPAAQYDVARMLEGGYGLSVPQPEIAERYYRLAAQGGYEDAEIDLARRLIAGRMLAKPENGANEAIDLLNRALSRSSARAANMLAEIYRNGELHQRKDALLAMKYAFLAMKLSVQADPTSQDGNPFFEFSAGIHLVEMALNGQAVDTNNHALLAPSEIDQLQRFYGIADSKTRKVSMRRLDVPLGGCNYPYKKSVWLWDWGRAESPTEPQFANLESETSCYDNDILRRTLSEIVRSGAKGESAFS